MASLSSIISILVLLAAYGYSVPLENNPQTSTYPTSNWEFTTGKTIVDNADRITAHLMNVQESASVPTVVIPREFMDRYTFSTPATMESRERDSRESQFNYGKIFTSTPFTQTTEFPSSNSPPRGFVQNNLFDTTTFRPINSAEEKFSNKFYSPKRAFESREAGMDKSNSAEIFSASTVRPSNSAEEKLNNNFGNPKRAFGSKEVSMDKSTSAEVFSTTPVFGGESTSAERGNVRSQEATTRMSSGMKNSVTRGSREVDRSSEESTVQETRASMDKGRSPRRPTPQKGKKPT